MLKKIALVVVALGCAVQAQAYDKKQTVLDKDFWGTWSVYNSKNKCTETYQFTKPAQFKYSSKTKAMTGKFAVVRNQDPKSLDILTMKVVSDNKKASCADPAGDFTNKTLSMGLKWVSKSTAQICSDAEGKNCSTLYLIKQN